MLSEAAISPLARRRTRMTPPVARAPQHLLVLDDRLRDTLRHLAAGFGEQVAIVSDDWVILSVNDAWKQMIAVAGYPELVPGTDYRDFLKAFAAKGHQNAAAVLGGVQAMDRGESDSFEFTYAGVDEWEGRTLELRIRRLRVEGHLFATIARYDVTDSAALQQVRADCSAAIMNSQTEARQRLTRELHDSTAQVLTSAKLLLETLKQMVQSPDCAPVVDEIQGLLTEATREIRSMAYLAHPPNVREIGIARALEALAAGFGRRAQLDVVFETAGRPLGLAPATKTAVYRIAQEALSNAYRHARAKQVRILLIFRDPVVHLVVADDGVGVSDETLAGRGKSGVGLAGMRSRLAEIGGRLTIRRLQPGTGIVATLRVHDRPDKADSRDHAVVGHQARFETLLARRCSE